MRVLPLCFAADLLEQIPKIDMHVHTTHTDGRMTVSDVLKLAPERGLKAVGFTDHARRTSRYIARYLEDIEEACSLFPGIEVFRGLEVKVVTLNGEIDLPEEAAASLDFVVGVIHRLPLNLYEEIYASWDEVTPQRAVDLEVEATLAMMRNGRAEIVGHPGRIFIEHYGTPFPDTALREVVEGAKRYNVAVELNARSPAFHFKTVLQHCLQANCLVSLGSDAHLPEEVGRAAQMVEQVLRQIS